MVIGLSAMVGMCCGRDLIGMVCNISMEFGSCGCIYGMVWRNGVIDIREWCYIDEIKHQSAGGGHLVDVGTLATMVQKVSTITLATVDGGNKRVIIVASTL